MRYLYTHTGTEATTGYFSCEPSPTPELGDALRYLAEHPLDDFMRRHLLRRMSALSPEEIREHLDSLFSPSALPAPIAALLEELALVNPALTGLASASAESAGSLQAATPLILLRWNNLPDKDLHRRWGDVFNANILQHRVLKSPQETGLPPLYPVGSPEKSPGLPGLSSAFTAGFPHQLADLFAARLAGPDGNAPAHTRPPSAETAALAEERLAAQGIIAGAEMRHTASLSPIALLRPWNIRLAVRQGRHAHSLEGQATTYGRGLSLADARASCLMEMVERASSYLSISENGVENRIAPAPVFSGSRSDMLQKHAQVLDPNDFPLEVPYEDQSLVWMRGTSPKDGDVLVPIQMAGLFCNLDETALYDSPGSTGIATGCSMEEAKLAALLEILERDAEATSPFYKGACFRLEADPDKDPIVAALLADYAAWGINVQFQDITGPMGVPVYKCFVMSPKGLISRGHGAGLSARKAVISALTETPFPYPDGGPSGPLLRKLPVKTLHELPEYSLPTPAANLSMLEELLAQNGCAPIYVDLTHEDLRFPVVRALIPGLELASDRDSFSRVPWRLWQGYCGMFAE